MQIELKKFNMSDIAHDSVIVLIGKRCTGKSVLARDIMYHHRDMPMGTVISATECANKFYSHFIPSLFIHDEFSNAIIDKFVKRQQMLMKKIEKETKVRGGCNIDPRAFLILDDCMFAQKAWINDRNMRFIFMNGRHLHILFMLTMQYPLGIPPNLRTNIDYVFILRDNLINNRRRIYENYAGMFPSFDIFCQVMDQCTENYECLVIHNNAKSNKLEDQVFWYKAPVHDSFQVCTREFWELSAECENDSDDDENGSSSDAIRDMNDASRKKKGSLSISVKKTATDEYPHHRP